MTESSLSKARIVAALDEEWHFIAELMARQTDQAWQLPAKTLPGWSVQDIVAHIIGTEASLLGETPPEATRDLKDLPYVHNDIGVLNEQWIDSMRSMSPSQVLDRFSEVTSKRAEAINEMTQEAFDAPSWTPAGQGTYGRFMQIRVYDCWLHEQDIRDTLDQPGHVTGPPAEISLDEITTALGYVVGKKAGAPDQSSVTFDIVGGVSRQIHVVVDGRASVVDSLHGAATTVLEIPFNLFVRLTGGRVDPEESLAEIGIRGDQAFGRRIVESLPFTV